MPFVNLNKEYPEFFSQFNFEVDKRIKALRMGDNFANTYKRGHFNLNVYIMTTVFYAKFYPPSTSVFYRSPITNVSRSMSRLRTFHEVIIQQGAIGTFNRKVILFVMLPFISS